MGQIQRVDTGTATPDGPGPRQRRWWIAAGLLALLLVFGVGLVVLWVTSEGSVDAGSVPYYSVDAGSVPYYSQNDPRWANNVLAVNYTIGQAGCALVAAATVQSALTGREVTPLDVQAMDPFGRTADGQRVDGLEWTKVGMEQVPWDLDTVRSQLQAGKPMIVGVDYDKPAYGPDPTSSGGANGTDHWVTIVGTGRDAQGEYFAALDFAAQSGGRIKLRLDPSGKLVGDGARPLHVDRSARRGQRQRVHGWAAGGKGLGDARGTARGGEVAQMTGRAGTGCTRSTRSRWLGSGSDT